MHKSLVSAFAGFVVTFICWIVLNALWNRMGPDYDEQSVLEIWRIPQMVQRCMAGFLGGYATAWIGGGGLGRKILNATLAAIPFAWMTYGMHTMSGLLAPLPAALLDPGMSALFTIAAGWVQFKFPLKP